MQITSVHHVQITIPTGGEADGRRFYCDLLGLPEIEKPDALRGRGGFWLQVGKDAVHIGTEPFDTLPSTKAHIAYEVDDLEAWWAHLAENGLTIHDAVPLPGFGRFYIYDPFGNRIELIQPH